jgi:hypothetical protein
MSKLKVRWRRRCSGLKDKNITDVERCSLEQAK